jgi:hypothetical protein
MNRLTIVRTLVSPCRRASVMSKPDQLLVRLHNVVLSANNNGR